MAAAETLETLQAIADGSLPGVPQDPALVTMTTKIKKSDGCIDWTKSAAVIEALVRACTPWPGAGVTLELNGEVKNITVTRARVVPNNANTPAGTVIKADRKGWIVACGEAALELLEVIPPGKKAMPGAGFLNGCREDLTGKSLLTGAENV